MLYYLIVCRSLTYAQRTASALERAGITAHIMRSPKSIAGEGCSHSVKVSQRNLPDALRILHRTELDPRRVYITAATRRCSCDLSGQRGHLSAKAACGRPRLLLRHLTLCQSGPRWSQAGHGRSSSGLCLPGGGSPPVPGPQAGTGGLYQQCHPRPEYRHKGPGPSGRDSGHLRI